MLKFLVISFLLFFIVYKILGFFFKLLIRNNISNHQQQQHQYRNGHYNKKPSDGNVTIDYVPDEGKKSQKQPDHKAGDYIDYEEVK